MRRPAQVAPLLHGAFTDRRLLAALARRCEVVTFDWENVPVASLRAHASRAHGARICPPVAALAAGQDRVREKRLFERLGIPTTRWRAVGLARRSSRAPSPTIGLPGVLKTRRLGYDGKGQAVVRTAAEAERAWRTLGGVPLLYEECVPFDCEVSIIGARSARGEMARLPAVRQRARAGDPAADARALRIARAGSGCARTVPAAACCAHFHYTGILTIEFFVRGGRLIANEMAPRVHNSGHWTIEGAVTSQFENHLRAILGLPLGAPAPLGHSAMINLIGTHAGARGAAALPGVHLHDYGKQPRAGPQGRALHARRADRRARRDARARRLLR